MAATLTPVHRTRGSDKQERWITDLLGTKQFNVRIAESKRTPSALITYLTGCEDRTDVTAKLSEGQERYARSMAADLGRDAGEVLASLTGLDRTSLRVAFDRLVDEHKAAARARRAADALMREAAQQLPVAHGYVLADGRYARTYHSPGNGVGVKVLTDSDAWERVPFADMRGARPITLDDAREIARRTKTCGHCGLTIETAESIERGVGPVCAKKF